MNSAKLTTTSGHTWSTSINGSYLEVKEYFLGKFFPVGSYDEEAPNEGFTQEQVVKLEFTEDHDVMGLKVPVTTIAELDQPEEVKKPLQISRDTTLNEVLGLLNITRTKEGRKLWQYTCIGGEEWKSSSAGDTWDYLRERGFIEYSD